MRDKELFINKVSLKDLPTINEYPYNIPLIKNFKEINLTAPVTFIVGENGSGKSTLIEALAVCLNLNPEGGSQNMKFSTFETHSMLYKNMVVTKSYKKPSTKYFFRAESFYNVATETDNNTLSLYGGMKGVSLHSSSHGESFINLIKNRFYDNGLYIMDEPEAALSATSQLKFLVLLDDLVKSGCQLVICTHSPIILSYPNSEIYQIEDGEITKKEYWETEIYSIYKRFMYDYKKVLNEVIKD